LLKEFNSIPVGEGPPGSADEDIYSGGKNMKKMKKLVAVLLVVAMVAALSACGNNGGNSGATSTPTPTSGGSSTEELKFDITVWCAENAVDLTTTQIAAFNSSNALGVTLNATVTAVGEGDAATQMITSVEDGADLYFFASDQFGRLVQANAVAKLGEAAAATVKADNTEGSVNACTAGGSVYAYPVTADNGYFLYYDKSVLSDDDVKTMEAIISKCESAGKNFAFQIEDNAWYLAGFFFGTGCVSEWTTDDDGNTIGVNDTFNSDAGLVAAKGIKALFNSSCFVNASSAATAFASGAAAVVSGTWDYASALEAVGEGNLGACKLPTFSVDGKTYQLGSFSGYKMIGVKPQQDAKKAAALQQLALYLSGEACQTERFNTLAWGPSNKAAQNTDAVKANLGQKAISEQDPYAVNQSGSISGSWWDIGKALGAEIKESDGTDAALKAALENYATKLGEIFTMSDDVKNAFTVIGAIGGSSWDKDFPMTQDGDVWTSNDAFDLKAGDEFKVRKGEAWDVAYGSPAGVYENAGNYVVEADGTYYIKLDVSTGTISLVTK